jgi:hypothetical protein
MTSPPRIEFDLCSETFVLSVDGAARLRDELSVKIAAAGRTPEQLSADILIGALRHTLALVEELKKTAPDEVVRIYATLFNHIRSACPEAVRRGQEQA